MLKNYNFLDSIYTSFERAASRRFESGESNYLEKLTAEAKKQEISIQLSQIKESIERNYIVLNQWLQSDTDFRVSEEIFERIKLLPLDSINHPMLNYNKNAQKLSNQIIALEKQKLLPDINASVFRGTNNGPDVRAYNGFQVGLAIPLWFKSQKSIIAAAKTEERIIQMESDNYKKHLLSTYEALNSDLKRYGEALNYYETTGKKLSDETLFYADKSYQSGEINFLQYAQLLADSKLIESNYLKSLLEYNRTVLEMNYLLN